MNKLFSLFCLSCTFVVSLFSAENYPYQDKTGLWQFETFTFSGSGRLDQAKNWINNKSPSGILPRLNIVGGSNVTLEKPYALSLSAMYLGMQNSKPAIFSLKKGGQLTMGSLNLCVGYVQDSTAEFHLGGGALTVGDLKDERPNGFLYIGVGTTLSGTARFVATEGTLVSGIRLGSDLPNTNVGTLVVKGSLPCVSTHRRNRNELEIYQSGTAEFVLDAKGVAPLDFRKSWLRIHEGATIRADGAAYKGGTQKIPLILYDKLIRLGAVNLQVSGFPPAYQATLSMEPTGVMLKITKASK